MKSYTTPIYIFTPGLANVGTIQIEIDNFNIRKLGAIINVSQNTIIYAPGLTGKGLANLSGNIVTLQANTSTHNANDELQILYDESQITADNISEITEAIGSLRIAINALSKSGLGNSNTDATGRLRGTNVIESGTVTTVTTVTTVGTVSNQSQIGGFSANNQIPAIMATAVGTIRSNINVT